MRNIFILLVELTIFIVLLGLYFVFMPHYLDSNYISLILVIVLMSITFFIFRKKNIALKNNYFTITFIFLLSYMIVHFQLYMDYALLLRGDLNLSYYLDYSIVPKAITLAALAIVAFLIGSIFFSLKSQSLDTLKVLRVPDFSLVFLIALIYIFFSLFIYFTPLAYFKGGYGELMNSDGGLGYLQYKANHLLQISLWAYIICNIIILSEMGIKLSFIEYLKTLKFPILLIIGLYFALNMLAGDRGPIIRIFILLFAGYLVSQRKVLNFKKMLLIIVIGGSFLQFISYLRVTDGSMGVSQRIESAIVIKNDRNESRSEKNESSVLPPTLELATSLRAYHAAIMDQEYNGILYGSGNIGYLLALIPGLGTLVQSITSINFSSSAVYITEVMAADHGMGTTVLADIYLNYGFLGTLFIFLFFGYFFAILDTRGYGSFANNSLFIQVLFLLFLSSALFIGRSTFAVVLSDVLLVYVLIKFSSGLKKISR